MANAYGICLGGLGVLIAGAIVAKFALRGFKEPRQTPSSDAVVSQLPEIVAALAESEMEGAFVVFLFPPKDSTTSECVHLQFSMKNHRLGLEWENLAPQNIQDVGSPGTELEFAL